MTINIGDIVKLDNPDYSISTPYGIVTAVDVEDVGDFEVYFLDSGETEIICLDGRGDGQPSLIVVAPQS
jgi:hypothetical protein